MPCRHGAAATRSLAMEGCLTGPTARYFRASLSPFTASFRGLLSSFASFASSASPLPQDPHCRPLQPPLPPESRRHPILPLELLEIINVKPPCLCPSLFLNLSPSLLNHGFQRPLSSQSRVCLLYPQLRELRHSPQQLIHPLSLNRPCYLSNPSNPLQK